MPSSKKNVAKDQYWIDKFDRIVVIRGENAKYPGHWNISFVSKNGHAGTDICISDSLIRKITKNEAKTAAEAYTNALVSKSLYLE